MYIYSLAALPVEEVSGCRIPLAEAAYQSELGREARGSRRCKLSEVIYINILEVNF